MAQNIVPNPGFEQIQNCPGSFGQIICPLTTPPFPRTVSDWFSAVPNSPDYYNGCSLDTYATVPYNYYGYKPAHSGKAYTGIVAYSGYPQNGPKSGYSEYVEILLTSPLVTGKVYEISCYVWLTSVQDPLHIINLIGMQELGAVLTPYSVTSFSTPLDNNYTPLRASTQYIDDTSGWVKITGQYVAHGGEQWLTLGSFRTEVFPLYKLVFPATPAPLTSYMSYYLVDDVAMTERPPCDTNRFNHDLTICNTDSLPVTLTSSSDSGVYTWNNGLPSRSEQVFAGGKYWVTSNSGCNVTADTFTLRVHEDTMYSSKEQKECSFEELTLSTRQNAHHYRWNTGDSTASIKATGFGTYWCRSYKDCKMYVDTIHLQLKATPIEIVPGQDVTTCNDQPVGIGTNYTDEVTYLWNNGETSCCIIPQETGTYTVEVSNECFKSSDTIDVKISRCSDCFFIPDAFTPNKDGLNDLFGVRALCDIDQFSIHIYNRWGQEIFKANDVNARWKGFHRADFAEQGVYYYYLQYNTVQNSEIKNLKGDITLIR